MAVVHYFLQDEGKKELYMYLIEGVAQDQVKLRDITRTFPESGRFHFRFRMAVPEGHSATALWMDYIDQDRNVPLLKGNIIVKALQLPPFSNERLQRKTTKRYKSGLSELYRSTSPTKSQSSRQIQTLSQTLPTKSPSAATKEHLRKASPTGLQVKPPEPLLVPKEENMISFSPFKEQQMAGKAFFPAENPRPAASPVSNPAKGLNENELREEKRQQVRLAIDEKVDDYKRRMAQEEQDHIDRLRSREQLGEVMDRWETRNMQKNNIRALLSTVHTVLWPEASWQPMSMSQLLSPAGVKKGYQIAMLKFHPDKHQNDSPNVKYICERVFAALNDAWKTFISENATGS